MRIIAVRPNLYCLTCVKNCIFQSVLAEVQIAKADLRCVVAWIHRDSVGPESTPITPVAGLFESDAHEEENQASHCRACENASMAPRPYSISDEPGRERNQEPPAGGRSVSPSSFHESPRVRGNRVFFNPESTPGPGGSPDKSHPG